MNNIQYLFGFCFFIGLISSCVDKDVYRDSEQEYEVPEYKQYLYPYDNEVQNVVAEITLETDGHIDPEEISAEIPFLKYNKSWLFMLTQDDCAHSAYSATWAAINGKPLSNNYYYNAEQLAAGDLPPDVSFPKKTLGFSDGAGNEVRFAFTTTLSPEWKWMSAETIVRKGYSKDYYRFYQKSGLTWSNVAEMLAYGTGIAFHDVNTQAVNLKDSIFKHYSLSQQIIANKLVGRGCKVLAEPNGNKTYVEAALDYLPIQIMTAQNTATGGPKVIPLFPFAVQTDLQKELLQRSFHDYPFDITSLIEVELRKPKEDRTAVHVGVHSTNNIFAQFLLWLNDRYGKDGDDSVWFPSLEEYYEYNYYRIHSNISIEVKGNLISLKILLPSQQYFYYPSVTVNLSGLKRTQIKQIISDDEVTGLSYADYGDGIMLNIDCRRYLLRHATHFVEKYESSRYVLDKRDALYFVNMLKESKEKSALLQIIK